MERRVLRRRALVAACALVSVAPALADNWWNAGTGKWEDPVNWANPWVPESEDAVFIDNGGTAELTSQASVLTLDVGGNDRGWLNVYAGGVLSAERVTVGSGGQIYSEGGEIWTDRFETVAGGVYGSNSGILGVNGAGQLQVVSGGASFVDDVVWSSDPNATGSGTGSILIFPAGGWVLWDIHGGILRTGTIVKDGEGDLNMTLSGGRISLQGLVFSGPGSSTLAISGGEMIFHDFLSFRLGNSDGSPGAATITQTGGVVRATGAGWFSPEIATGGRYRLINGVVDLIPTEGDGGLFVNGGSFEQSGGNFRATSAYGDKGALTLSGGSMWLTDGMYTGFGFTQTGGTLTIGGNMQVTTPLAQGGSSQSGGTTSVGGALTVGNGAGFTLSGTGSRLTSGQIQVSNGAFTQSGGTSITGSVSVAGASGVYSINRGALSAGSVTASDGGTFGISTVGNVAVSGSVTAGSAGTVSLSGSGRLTAQAVEVQGTLNQSGGMITADSFTTGDSGHYAMTGGTLNINDWGQLGVSNASVNVNGRALWTWDPAATGTHSGSIAIDATGGSVNLDIHGGRLDAGSLVRTGTGNFNMTLSDGVVSVDRFQLGGCGNDTLTISGGELVLRNPNWGDFKLGSIPSWQYPPFTGPVATTVTQSGGTVRLGDMGTALLIEQDAVYRLSGGVLDLICSEAGGSWGMLGMEGGSFEQSGGTLRAYSIWGSSAGHTDDEGQFIVDTGVTLSGGTIEVPTTVDAWFAFTQSGGSLIIGDGLYANTNHWWGGFNQSGGSTTVAGVVQVGQSSGGGPAQEAELNLSGAGVLSAGSVAISNGGTLNQSGGSLSTGAISVTGSGLHWTEQNTQYTAPSLYALSGGSLSGALLDVQDNGSFAQSGNATATIGGGTTVGAGSSFAMGGTGRFSTSTLDIQGAGTQSGGTINTGRLSTSDIGTFTSTGGTLNIGSTGQLAVNHGNVNLGSGLLWSTDPTATGTHSGNIAVDATGGSVMLNVHGGSLDAGDFVRTGSGNFTMNLSDGVMSVNRFQVGGTGTNTLNISGGELVMNTYDWEGVLLGHAGWTFDPQNPPSDTTTVWQSGGTLRMGSEGSMPGIGLGATYHLSGGTLELYRPEGWGVLAIDGGSFEQTGGTVYADSVSSWAYSMDDGTGSTIWYGNGIIFGGGSMQVQSNMMVGSAFTQSGGSLTIGGDLYANASSSLGGANQSGGTASVAGALWVGQNSGGYMTPEAEFNLSGSGALSAGSVAISNGGTLNQSGGSLSTGAISVTGNNAYWDQSGSTTPSLYALSGGSLSGDSLSMEQGEWASGGRFAQSGNATATIRGGTTVGANSSFALGGTGQFNTGSLDVQGTASQSGGTLTTGRLTTSEGGTFASTGGTLNIGSTGQLAVNHGNVSFGSGLLWSTDPAAVGTHTGDIAIDATGGSVNLAVHGGKLDAGNLVRTGSGNFAMNLSDGTLSLRNLEVGGTGSNTLAISGGRLLLEVNGWANPLVGANAAPDQPIDTTQVLQSGGEVRFGDTDGSGMLFINPGATYYLSGGVLDLKPHATLWWGGLGVHGGSLEQSGGTLHASDLWISQTTVTSDGGEPLVWHGRMSLSGGLVQIDNNVSLYELFSQSGGTLSVGQDMDVLVPQALGGATQSGGSTTVGSTLGIGQGDTGNTAALSQLNLQGTGQLTSGSVAIAQGSMLSQSGGSLNTGAIAVSGSHSYTDGAGEPVTVASQYLLSGGSLTGSSLDLQDEGTGTGGRFVQSGNATGTISGATNVGQYSNFAMGGTGRFSTSTLDIQGAGTQSGGTINTGRLATSDGGTFTSTGGTLNIGSTDQLRVTHGSVSVGSGLLWSSDPAAVGTHSGNIAIDATGGSVNLDVHGGSLDAGDLIRSGSGDFTMNLSDGVISVNRFQVGGTGTNTLNISGGELVVNTPQWEWAAFRLGHYSNPPDNTTTVWQSGGTVRIAGVGAMPEITDGATYHLSGGTLEVLGTGPDNWAGLYIGNATLEQSGGTLSASTLGGWNAIIDGQQYGNGIMLSGGSMQVRDNVDAELAFAQTGGSLGIGGNLSATSHLLGGFRQSGGTTTVGGVLQVGKGGWDGSQYRDNAEFNLSDSGALSAGSVEISNGGALNQSGGSLSAGAVTVTGNNAYWNQSGSAAPSLYALSSGSLSGDSLSVEQGGWDSGGRFAQSGNATATIRGGTTVGANSSFAMGGTGQFTTGSMDVQGMASQSGGHLRVNSGLAVRSGGSYTKTGGTTSAVSVDVSDSGAFVQSAGITSVTGEMSVGSGATASLTGSTARIFAGGISVAGAFDQSAGIVASDALRVAPGGTYTYSGGTLTLGSTWDVQGTMDFTDSSVGVQVGPSSTVDLSAGQIQRARSAWVNITGTDSLAIVAPGQVDVFGSFTNAGTTHTLGSTLDVEPGSTVTMNGQFADPVRVSGTVQITQELVTHNSITLGGGSITGGGTLQLGDGSTFNGNGTAGVSVQNQGLVSPGNSPGTIHIAGDYTQEPSGTLLIEVAGLGDGQHDLLQVDNAAQLAGTLQVQLISGFTPEVGQSVTFLTNGSLTGEFSSVQSGGLPQGIGLAVEYYPHNAVISFVSVPEPGILLGVGLASGALLMRPRRRKTMRQSHEKVVTRQLAARR